MKKESISNGLVKLSADERHILHRVGDTEYPVIRQTTVKAADVDRWEEVAVEDVPAITEAQYNAKVAELIRKKYSADEENAIKSRLLNALLHPEAATLDETGDSHTPKEVRQFDEFYAYRLECLEEARNPDLYADSTPAISDWPVEETGDGAE